MRKDITGKRFGRLVVQKQVSGTMCQCICDCGNSALILRGSLTTGNTISCGCAHKDMLRSRNAVLNPKRRKPELGDLEGKDRLRVAARLYYQTSEKCKAKAKVQDGARRTRKRATGAEIALTGAQWRLLVECFGGRCAYCDCVPEKITIDHMTPLCKGGAHVWQNVVPACWSCNSTKHDKDLGVALDLLGVDREVFWKKIELAEERLGAA